MQHQYQHIIKQSVPSSGTIFHVRYYAHFSTTLLQLESNWHHKSGITTQYKPNNIAWHHSCPSSGYRVRDKLLSLVGQYVSFSYFYLSAMQNCLENRQWTATISNSVGYRYHSSQVFQKMWPPLQNSHSYWAMLACDEPHWPSTIIVGTRSQNWQMNYYGSTKPGNVAARTDIHSCPSIQTQQYLPTLAHIWVLFSIDSSPNQNKCRWTHRI